MTLTEQPPVVEDTVPADLDQDQPDTQADQEVPATFLATTWATVTEHVRRASQRTRTWISADSFTAEDWNERALAHRAKVRTDKLRALQQQGTTLQQQIREARHNASRPGGHGHHDHEDGYEGHRDDPHIRQLREQLHEVREEIRELQAAPADDLPPTPAELRKARLAVQGQRAAMVVGGVIGGEVLLPLQNPAWLLASLPALAVALWRLGLRGEDEDQQQTQPDPTVVIPGQVALAEQPLAGPGFAAAIVAARVAAENAATPGAAAAREVAAAAEEAAQVQGSADLLDALVRAGIISQAEKDETHLVGAIHPDGPGWRARIDLPRGRPAEHAISRGAELASALRVRTSQIQLAKDTADDAHEGRLTLWVADAGNPFAGAPIPSELMTAESWDFWAQGVPLGIDARGLRRVLNLIWSSLLIGGLMGYGKTYLARLVAAAAVLDPYVNIILISGKSSADWAALKLVARQYVVGNSADTIREMHEVMEGLIEEMDAQGKRLEALFESDPKSCPEGKVTPDLARRDGLGLTLLIVDELQEILDAAAGMKLVSADEFANWSGEGNGPKGQSGKGVMVSAFARYVRVARAVGGMGVFVTQRPDASSVPTELREVCAKRASYRVKGANSSKMVLGDDAVAAGASPHLITETQRGVLVLDEGAEEGHATLRADLINLDEFRTICERGRALRLKASTLRGQAADRWNREREQIQRQQVITDAIAAMDAHGVTVARLVVLAAWMAELSPEFWDGITDVDLGARLRAAGAGTTTRIGSVDGVAKASGYTRDQLAAALSSPAA